MRKILSLLIALAVSAVAQPSPDENVQLPSQAKPVEGILVPVPKEIFASLDQFRNANWRAVQRPEIARWKSRGDQVQITLLLGTVVAEGFIAMEAQDPNEVRDIGNRVLTLSRALGVERTALRRSRSIMDHADNNQWSDARKEWDGVLADLENGMIALKSEPLSQLVSISGWVRGTDALCDLVLQDYSPDRAQIIRQPAMLNYLEQQLAGMKSQTGRHSTVAKVREGLRKIRSLIEKDPGPPSEATVKEIAKICRKLVAISSQRPA